jgi:hypothetical protein
LAGFARASIHLAVGDKKLVGLARRRIAFGETTTAADVDASGKVLNVRQVLQVSEFYKAEVGKWTRDDVRVNFGKPERTAYFPLMKREVWSYRYQEDGVWYMLYHFYFDANGVLRLTQKSPDPPHDPGRHGR